VNNACAVGHFTFKINSFPTLSCVCLRNPIKYKDSCAATKCEYGTEGEYVKLFKTC
jgi:hypothetical protein